MAYNDSSSRKLARPLSDVKRAVAGCEPIMPLFARRCWTQSDAVHNIIPAQAGTHGKHPPGDGGMARPVATALLKRIGQSRPVVVDPGRRREDGRNECDQQLNQRVNHARGFRVRTYPRPSGPWDTADIRDHEGCASGA